MNKLSEKDSIILDYILLMKKTRLEEDRQYSEKTHKRLLREAAGERTRFEGWYDINKKYADVLGVSMSDYVIVMFNAQDCMEHFIMSHYTMPYLYQSIKYKFRSHIISNLQRKEEKQEILL